MAGKQQVEGCILQPDTRVVANWTLSNMTGLCNVGSLQWQLIACLA